MYVCCRAGATDCRAVIIKGSIAGIKVTAEPGAACCSYMHRTRLQCVWVCGWNSYERDVGRMRRVCGEAGGRWQVIDMYSMTQINRLYCQEISAALNTFDLKQIFRTKRFGD